MDILWTEQYRPKYFDDLNFHNETNQQLQNLVENGNMPHIIFYGPDGGGKRTRTNCVLSKLYGKGVLRTNKDIWSTKHKSSLIEINIRHSKYHIEMNPSDVGNQDRLILTKLIKESATNSILFSNSNNQNNFTTFVIYDAEKMTTTAQAALRRTLEKYSEKIRVIMICQTIGNLLPAIKSRCLLMRIKSPSINDIKEVLQTIGQKQNFSDDNLVNLIAENCNQNLRKAIIMFQNSFLTGINTKEEYEEIWKKVIRQNIVNVIQNKPEVSSITSLRKTYYDLLANQIPGDEIMKEVLV